MFLTNAEVVKLMKDHRALMLDLHSLPIMKKGRRNEPPTQG